MLNKEELIPPRIHCTRYAPEFVMYIMLEGELHLEECGKNITLLPGDIYIFKKGEFHKPVKSTFCKYYYVHFESDEFSEYDMNEEEYCNAVREKRIGFLKTDKYTKECYQFMKVVLKKQGKIENKGFFDYCINVLENNTVSHKYQDMEKRMSISNNVAKIFLKLENVYVEQTEEKNRESTKIYGTVKRIIDYVEENYKSNICGEDIEKEFFLNFDYANRIFKKIMGNSIIKYRNILRINAAKMSMIVSDKTLTEISEEVGFRDSCYFNRIFKRFEGTTPGEYKKQILTERNLQDKER